MANTVERKQTHPAIIVIVIIGGIVAFGALISQCSAHEEVSASPIVSGKDQRAYDELRRQGYTDGQARDAAPSIRRLCEAGGGTDCR